MVLCAEHCVGHRDVGHGRDGLPACHRGIQVHTGPLIRSPPLFLKLKRVGTLATGAMVCLRAHAPEEYRFTPAP